MIYVVSTRYDEATREWVAAALRIEGRLIDKGVARSCETESLAAQRSLHKCINAGMRRRARARHSES